MSLLYNLLHFLFVKWKHDTTVWFVVISAIALVSCFAIRFKCKWKMQKAFILYFAIEYLVLVFLSTVFTRRILETPRTEISFLWSYRWGHRIYGWNKVLTENVINILLLMPLAVLLLLLIKRRYFSVFGACFIISSSIELFQYFMRRGTLEIDDLFHNMVGVVLAILLYAIIARRKYRSSS